MLQQKDNTRNRIESRRKINLFFFLLAYFTVLIIAVIRAVVASAIVFVLIADLHSDLTAALKDSSSSSHVTIDLKPQLNMLSSDDLNNFRAITDQQILYLKQNVTNGFENMDQQTNVTHEPLTKLQFSEGTSCSLAHLLCLNDNTPIPYIIFVLCAMASLTVI